VVVLVVAAAATAYAAFHKSGPKPLVVTKVVAAVPPPAAAAPATPVPSVPATPTPKAAVPVLPAKATIPLTPVVTKAATPSTPAPAASTPSRATTTPAGEGSTGSSSGEPPPSSAILLDTNSATTYNPSALPASDFGDPSLAIDGEPSTGWTAIVDPAVAPKMQAGLQIDLRSPQKVGSLTVITSTPGMRVQVYGVNAATAPATIADPAWIKLAPSFVVSKRHQHLKLHPPLHSVRYVVLWISHAPAASVGTPQRPGHVSVNEIELFPTG
jgi:hypothetical protein